MMKLVHHSLKICEASSVKGATELDTTQCLNPDCLAENPLEAKTCQKCGSKLLLGDRYRPVSALGKGGMGRTFLAVDEHRLNTICVIKQFLPLTQNSADLEKLIQLFIIRIRIKIF